MRFLVFTMLWLVIPGCQGDPYVDWSTTTEPKMADVAGRYLLTNQTVQTGGLSVLEGNPSIIELRGDGTFTATHVPARESDPESDQFFSTQVSASGTWKIDVVGSIANGDQPPKKHSGIQFTSKEFEIMQVRWSLSP